MVGPAWVGVADTVLLTGLVKCVVPSDAKFSAVMLKSYWQKLARPLKLADVPVTGVPTPPKPVVMLAGAGPAAGQVPTPGLCGTAVTVYLSMVPLPLGTPAPSSG